MDKKAFTQLYIKHSKEIYRYCLMKSTSKEEAEDCLSTVFIQLYKSENVTHPRAWLYKCVSNYFYHHNTDKHKSANVKLEDEEMENIQSGEKSLEQKIFQDLDIENILNIIKKLDVKTSDIITLRVFEGLSFQEISNVLDIKETTARVTYQRGIEKVRKKLTSGQNLKLNLLTLPAFFLFSKNFLKTSKAMAKSTTAIQSIDNNLLIKITDMAGVTSFFQNTITYVSNNIATTVGISILTIGTLSGSLALAINPGFLNKILNKSQNDLIKDANFLAESTLGTAPYSDDRYSLEKVNDNTNKYTNFEYGISFEYDSKFKVDNGIEFIDFNKNTKYGWEDSNGFWLEVFPNFKNTSDLKVQLTKYLFLEKDLTFEELPNNNTVNFSGKKFVNNKHIANIHGTALGIPGNYSYIFVIQSPVDSEIDNNLLKKISNTFSFNLSIKKNPGINQTIISPFLGLGISLPSNISFESRKFLDRHSSIRKNYVEEYMPDGSRFLLSYPLVDENGVSRLGLKKIGGMEIPIADTFLISSIPYVSNFRIFLEDEIKSVAIKNAYLGNIKFVETPKNSTLTRADYTISINENETGFATYVYKNNTVYFFYTEKNLIDSNFDYNASIENANYFIPSVLFKKGEFKNLSFTEKDNINIILSYPTYFNQTDPLSPKKEITSKSNLLSFKNTYCISVYSNCDENRKSFSLNILGSGVKTTKDFEKAIEEKSNWFKDNTTSPGGNGLVIEKFSYQLAPEKFITVLEQRRTSGPTAGIAKNSYYFLNLPIKKSSGEAGHLIITASAFGEDKNAILKMLNSIEASLSQMTNSTDSEYQKVVKSTENSVSLTKDGFTFNATRGVNNVWSYTVTGKLPNGCENATVTSRVLDLQDDLRYSAQITVSKTSSGGMICTQAIRDFSTSGTITGKGGNGIFILDVLTSTTDDSDSSLTSLPLDKYYGSADTKNPTKLYLKNYADATFSQLIAEGINPNSKTWCDVMVAPHRIIYGNGDSTYSYEIATKTSKKIYTKANSRFLSCKSYSSDGEYLLLEFADNMHESLITPFRYSTSEAKLASFILNNEYPNNLVWLNSRDLLVTLVSERKMDCPGMQFNPKLPKIEKKNLDTNTTTFVLDTEPAKSTSSHLYNIAEVTKVDSTKATITSSAKYRCIGGISLSIPVSTATYDFNTLKLPEFTVISDTKSFNLGNTSLSIKLPVQDNYNSAPFGNISANSPYKWTFEEKLAGSEYVVRFSPLGYSSPSAPGSIADAYFNIKLVPTNQSLDEYYDQYLNTNVFSKEGFAISTLPTYKTMWDVWTGEVINSVVQQINVPIKEFDLLTPAISEHKIFFKKDGYIIEMSIINSTAEPSLSYNMIDRFFR